MNYIPFYKKLNKTRLKKLAEILPEKVNYNLFHKPDGNLPKVKKILDSLPDIPDSFIDLNTNAVTIKSKYTDKTILPKEMKKILKKLHPWRKGPYDIFGIHIDTEWRSDWKWDRIKNHIAPLKNKLVLDVGCGNGYHCWRMRGTGAKLVMGIDPLIYYIAQFWVFQKYIQDHSVSVLPLKLEDICININKGFDTIFSMGVLYHARSPFDHLLQLKALLHADGQLVLETLIIDGKEGEILVPEGRYAKMRNVWFIPSIKTLESWLRRVGFKQIQLVDINKTSIKEQRVTEWLNYESLENFLNPVDHNYTIEGYPAPKRAVFIASI